MNKKINCSKYTIFNLHQKNEPFSWNKQFDILFKILKWFDVYEKENYKILKYIEQKWLIENNKITEKWKCFILNIKEMKFWQKFYLLALFIIFWLPFILITFWKYIPINWDYWFYFYIFMITFWMFFIMKKNKINREKYLQDFINKYF